MSSQKTTKMDVKKIRKIAIRVLAALFVLAIVFYAYSWYKGYPIIKFNNPQDTLTLNGLGYNYDDLPPDLKAAKDVQDRQIIKSVLQSQINIPNEEFILQEIVDASKLRGTQAFFANAQNGDKLVIFKQAKFAVLFRSTGNLIISKGELVIK